MGILRFIDEIILLISYHTCKSGYMYTHFSRMYWNTPLLIYAKQKKLS